jgi:hypothetical protein
MHPSSVHLDHEQHIKPAQKDRVEVEEVASQQHIGLGTQECPPRGVHLPGRRATAVAAQDPPHGRCTQLTAQTEDFAMYSPISPLGILACESVDQLAGLLVRRWAAWLVRVPPPVGYQATVPGQQRGRSDQPVHPQLSRQQPGQRRQNRSIWPRGAWLADLATQDRDLVP